MNLKQLWTSGKDFDRLIVVEMPTSVRKDSHFRGLGDMFANEIYLNKNYHKLCLYDYLNNQNFFNLKVSNHVFVIFSFWEFVLTYKETNWKRLIQQLTQNNFVIIFSNPTVDENNVQLSTIDSKSFHHEIKKLRYITDQYWIAIGEAKGDIFHFKRIHCTSRKFFSEDYITFKNIDGIKSFLFSTEHPLGLDNKAKIDEKGMNPEKPKNDVRFDQNQGSYDEKSLPFLTQQNESGGMVEMGSNTVRAGGRIIFQEDECMEDVDDDLDI
uniref:Elongator complex protein 5 n=1 Tax=Strongyloides venezuelensis TaxID=75913 RepID=A0A0K0F8V6_STRVS